jgi:16S rRNA G1207 methylase RsmC
MNDTPDHYFSVAPKGDTHRAEFTLPTAKGDMTVVTEGGVFSHGQLDKGTAVLLDFARKHPEVFSGLPDGDLVDVGCGAGPIALALAAALPDRTIWAVDVNERARQLCAENARANNLHNITVVTPDQVPHDALIAAAWSNPPIRVGKNELHQILETWLARVNADGRTYLVVNKNLGADSLRTWMENLGYSTEKLASSKGFRVLKVTRQ